MDKRPIVLRSETIGSEQLREGDNLSVNDNRIIDVADPIDETDAVNLRYLSSIGSSTLHSSMLGLLSDDHPQYHNDARAATWYETNYYVIPAGTPDPIGAAGHWLLAWNDTSSTVEWFWSYELPDFSGATEKDVLRVTALNTWEWAARGVNLVSTYMLFANVDTEIAGTDKLIFNGTDFTLASGSALRSIDILVCAPGGTGGFQLSSTGNARGTYAVDLQISRAVTTQVASGSRSSILGGYNNTASGIGSCVLSGDSNVVSGQASLIASGYQNSIISQYCYIGGGTGNQIDAAVATYSAIVSGYGNLISNYRSIICGGYLNSIDSTYSVIVGGQENYINVDYGCIAGGRLNKLVTSSGGYSAVTGGIGNTTVAAATYNGTNILGGYYSSIQGQYSVINGGYSNSMALAAGVVCSVIGGGQSNSVTASRSVIAGGISNVISNIYSSIGGGSANNVSGAYSAVPGGRDNTVSGENGSAIGRSAVSSLYGQFAQASGKFSTNGDAQSSILISRKQTTNDTPTELFLDNASLRITIAEATTWFFIVKVIARQTNDDFSVAAYHIEGIITRDTGGNATIINQSTIYSNETDIDWDFVVSADTINQSLKLLATGKALNNINWVAKTELTEVTG